MNKQVKQINVNGKTVTIKLIIIFGLLLAMLLPQQLIKSIVKDRAQRQDEVIQNIAHQIGNYQDVVGPILCVPYYENIENVTYDVKNIQHITYSREKRYIYITPQELNISSQAEVTNKEKSIYKVPFFQSKTTLKGKFPTISDSFKIPKNKILYEESFIIMGVTDLKGISTSPTLQFADATVNFQAGLNNAGLLQEGVHAILPKQFWENENSGEFTVQLAIRGTKSLNFAGIGKVTTLKMASNWAHPNFESTLNMPYEIANNHSLNRENTLPTSSTILEQEKGFTATWKESQFTMSNLGQWLSSQTSPKLYNRLMGVEFINVADQYSKSDRSIKYLPLIVTLIFASFFCLELLKNTRVHPFQYVLIGSAIAIFYILLLALSEYFGFNLSYVFASVATTLLISLYSISVFKSKSLSIGIALLLAVVFTFLFVILIATQYSLIMGAVALFTSLALLMYVTRNINWYKDVVE